MIEKLRKIRDEKGVFAAVLTDLSKAFDCIPHQLLIAKLSAYGFDMKSIAFIFVYLKNRKQKAKIGSTLSECLNILFGVSQGFILGPLLFLIFIADLFYLNYDLDFASFGDDTTPYCCFSYAGTWELVNLFVGTKNFSYHFCYENIAKYSRVKRQIMDRLN